MVSNVPENTVAYSKDDSLGLEVSNDSRLLSTLMANLPGIAYRCQIDASYTMLFLSEGCLSFTGYHPAELLHNREISYNEITFIKDRARVRATIEAATAQYSNFEVEYRIVTKAGELRWVLERGVCVFDPERTPQFLEGLIIDIHDRRRAEEENRLLQNLTRVIYKAQTFESALETALAEVCEVENWTFGEAWVPAPDRSCLVNSTVFHYREIDDDAGNWSLADFEQARRSITFQRGVGLPGLIWESGEPVWMSDITQDPSFFQSIQAENCGLKAGFGVPVLVADKVVAVLVFCLERSCSEDRQLVELMSAIGCKLGELVQRQQAEARQRFIEKRLVSMADATPGIFYSAANEPNFPLTYVSDSCVEITGYKPEELTQQNGHYLNKITHPADAARVLDAIQTAIQKEYPYLVEYRIQTRDGQEKWLWEKGRGVQDAQGKIIGLEGFISDISDRKRVEEALRESEAELRAIFAAMDDAVLVIDKGGNFQKIAPTNHRLLFQESDSLLGKNLIDIFTSEQAAEFLIAINQCLTRQQTITTEYHFSIGNQVHWFLASVSPVNAELAVWMARDITEQKRAEQAKREADARYRQLVENIPEGVFQATLSGQYLSVNSALAQIYGYRSPDELLRLDPQKHRRYLIANRQQEITDLLFEQDSVVDLESQVRRRDGSIIWISENIRAVRDATQQVCYYEGTVQDITQRRLDEQQLYHQAYFDSLTGLPNRDYFMDRLHEYLHHPDSQHFAILFLDLDRFKLVNDSLGHHIGDRLLAEIALRLRRCLRSQDLLARLGGDEFTVLLEQVSQIEDVITTAERIQEALAQPFQLGPHQVFTGTSIGVYLYRSSLSDRLTSEELLQAADIALYEAKAAGRGTYRIFNRSMQQEVVALMDWETELRQALQRGEFELYYQPIVALENRRIAGFEALLRWRHPTRGLVSPTQFIAIAEEIGCIVPIGIWVLETACRQLSQWQQQLSQHGLSHLPLTMAVNLSVRQFAQPDLLDVIKKILLENKLSGRQLCLEITESCLLNYPDAAADILTRLQALGVQLSLDDFGTGYSGLNYLRQLPINTIKIDRTYVQNLVIDQKTMAITRAIFKLTDELAIRTVAEGIETSQQLEILQELGSTYGQGYLFSHPLSVMAADELLLSKSGAALPTHSHDFT
ncbi:MAG: EAL domain-containing protein [Cyanobacteria bacterium P01_H01_bin.15]